MTRLSVGEDRVSSELENFAADSPRRSLQRPCSTQKAGTRIRLAARWHDKVRAEGAVLPATLDHVSSLQEQVEVREVFDLQLADVARLVELGEAIGEAFAEHEELPGWKSVPAGGFPAHVSGRAEQTHGEIGEDGGFVEERICSRTWDDIRKLERELERRPYFGPCSRCFPPL